MKSQSDSNDNKASHEHVTEHVEHVRHGERYERVHRHPKPEHHEAAGRKST